MRSSFISFLVSFAAGTCLPDAIPPAQRKNLVNLNGDTYPVGLFAANYDASFAANVLAATLLEEALGYNVTVNLDTPGSGTVPGYYAVTGCQTPNNVADRGCIGAATRYHIHMEAWIGGYTLDWSYIQRTYASTAPKNLGSMGYKGLSTMYMPKPIQEAARNTEGLSLEFYRNWNATWNEPWKFFGAISSVNASRLAPCNKSDSVMQSDATMRRHIHFTGDTAGVVINNDVYSARCDDGFWWTPPSCRSNQTRCVGLLTAGTGWGAEIFMQKFTIFNMPVALAIAASWTDYTEVPLSGEMCMFWWSPDPTFLDLSPVVVQFPPHNSREYAEGLLTSADAGAVVSTIVSRDLAALAPLVESFVDQIYIPLNEMNNILFDHKNTRDDWTDVTCRWIQANRDSWQKWMPDASKCSPGFGLYDTVERKFAHVRVNAQHDLVCEACAPGTFSRELTDDRGVTYVCEQCGNGTSQTSGAEMSCKACKAGEYQDELGSKECKRCTYGTYQDEIGQVSCKTCPPSTSTMGLGSVAESECGCPADYINMDITGGFVCTECPEGMTCPALSSLVALKDGHNANGEEFIPRIQKGYYSTKQTPTQVFRCKDEAHCPGGTPGSCAKGLDHLPCSRCAKGATWTGTSCAECGGWRQALWALAICGIGAFLTFTYHLTTSQVKAKATVFFAVATSCGMLVLSMQNVGLIGLITVAWPASFNTIFSVCQFLLLDIDAWGFSCVAGRLETLRYLFGALLFPAALGWLTLCYAVSRCLPEKYHWEGPRVCSTMGAFLDISFSTMSATSLAPLMCYQHPNGLRSVLKYPGVICGSGEHQFMLAVGWTLLLVFVLGFWVLCAFGAWMVPEWSVRRKDDRCVAFGFLIYRFRLDSWWFGVLLLIRGPFINLPVALATDFSHFQVVAIVMLLTLLMVMQMIYWPWKVPILNATDSTISFGIVLFTACSGIYLTEADKLSTGSTAKTRSAFAELLSMFLLNSIALILCVMFAMVGMGLFYRAAMGTNQELECLKLGKVADSKELAKKVKDMARALEACELKDLQTRLRNIANYDVDKFSGCITLLAIEIVLPADDRGSFRFEKRIAAVSFDPSLEKHVQRRRKERSLRNSLLSRNELFFERSRNEPREPMEREVTPATLVLQALETKETNASSDSDNEPKKSEYI